MKYIFLMLIASMTTAGGAAQTPTAAAPSSPTNDSQVHAQQMVIESMSHHHMHSDAHLRLTARRPERPGDRERAQAIVAALAPALERYRDYRVALENGYHIFMPKLPQDVYHFTNTLEGLAEAFRFRPDQATSLLYRKTRDGYELVGAMYTAPADEPEVDLDARVPLSIAQWHQHVNICLPARGLAEAADWTKFGPSGSIATAEECSRAEGRFLPRIFGWMVHVYPFEKTFEKIWAMD